MRRRYCNYYYSRIIITYVSLLVYDSSSILHTSVINILNQYFYRSNIMKLPRESYLNCLVLSLELIQFTEQDVR